MQLCCAGAAVGPFRLMSYELRTTSENDYDKDGGTTHHLLVRYDNNTDIRQAAIGVGRWPSARNNISYLAAGSGWQVSAMRKPPCMYYGLWPPVGGEWRTQPLSGSHNPHREASSKREARAFHVPAIQHG
jgi:hypothetical protein